MDFVSAEIRGMRYFANMNTIEIPTRPARKFVPESFTLTSFEAVKPYLDKLLEMQLGSAEALRLWLQHRSEVESIISEDMGWRYIRMTCHTENEAFQKSYQDFVQNIQPHLAPLADKLNKKALDCPFLKDLEVEPGFNLMIRSLKKDVDLFREENVPLFTQINTDTQKYSQLSGAMTVTFEGQEITLQQAAVLLQDTNRQKREAIYHLISERRLKDKAELATLYSNLIALRHQVAKNAGFGNFRDYQFKAYGRFDYTASDCFDFHEAIKNEVVPLLNELAANRKQNLGVPKLRPWDKAVDAEGRPALKAFHNSEELTAKSIDCFKRLDPYLGQCLEIMNSMGHLDLESRKGKAPGGYNYPLAEIGVPFIFMNATSTMRDMTTLMHEGGHAVHNFLTKDLELADFKSPPMEVAELASMAMELISMDHWNLFFPNPADLARARQEQLEDLIETLPWVATIDKFQHWVYENPSHSEEERIQQWNEIFDAFADTLTDWEGLQEAKDFLWQKQLHLYEVPFYYIEYGMAQLGAIAVWRNYRKNPQQGLQGYMNALKLGYMKTIPEIYAAAGIRFDFSRGYIRELMDFVRGEMQAERH